MLQKETVFKILKKAAVIDKYLELFGSSNHGYKLNPVISSEFLLKIYAKGK